MRLYPKKLRGIKDLHRERKRLLQERAALEQDELFTMQGLVGGFAGGAGRGGFSFIDLLPISNPWVKAGIRLAGNWFSKRKEHRQAAKEKDTNDDGHPKHSKVKNMLGSFAKEFIGGYLKWKGIELSAKGVSHIIKKKREARKKEE